MANPHRGEVALQAGDQTYTLSYSINAICDLEDALGKPVGHIMQSLNDEGGASMKTVRALVWAGLQDHHDVDERAAGLIATEVGVTEIVQKIGDALKLAFPEREAGNSSTRPRKARSPARLNS